MPLLELQPEYLNQIKTILRENATGLEIWAYGSRVKGNSHDASDLDLVLRNPQDLLKSTHALSQLKQSFRDSDLPFLVDIMDWSSLSDDYRNEILKHYVIIDQDHQDE